MRVLLNPRINKKTELNIMVYDIQPHIIGIAESWADNDQARIQLLAKGEVVKIMELQLLLPQ